MWMILKESGDEQEVPSALLANSLLANKFYLLKILQLASPHSKVVSFEKIPIGWKSNFQQHRHGSKIFQTQRKFTSCEILFLS